MLDVSVHHYSAFSIVRLSGIDIGITERRKHNYSTKDIKDASKSRLSAVHMRRYAEDELVEDSGSNRLDPNIVLVSGLTNDTLKQLKTTNDQTSNLWTN